MGLFDRLFGHKGKADEPVEDVSVEEFDDLPGEAPAPPGRQPVLRIEIDRQSCTGMAECVRIAPQVFALDEENMAIVVDASAATREQLLRAARECPTQAIRLYELDGTQVYPDWM
ncbi:MAG: ferredoxin [Chloroflexi bacterium]|nr:ferredoxin [Chloroflexota bacterium]